MNYIQNYIQIAFLPSQYGFKSSSWYKPDAFLLKKKKGGWIKKDMWQQFKKFGTSEWKLFEQNGVLKVKQAGQNWRESLLGEFRIQIQSKVYLTNESIIHIYVL